MKRNKLDELLNNKRKLRAIECNSGLSALIIEKTKIKKNQEEKEYDALLQMLQEFQYDIKM